MGKTESNLQEAFAGESQANRKYLAYAKQAETDGFPNLARLFRGVAEAETAHAHAHLRALGGVKRTEENLEAAIEGEGFEIKEMYPGFVEEAREEKNGAAVKSFAYALAVEKLHHKLYSDAMKTIKTGEDIDASRIYVCPVCGNTVIGGPPEKCPICGEPESAFKKIE